MSIIKIERSLLEKVTLLLGWYSWNRDDDAYSLMRNAYENGAWNRSRAEVFSSVSLEGFSSLRVRMRDLVEELSEVLVSKEAGDSHYPQLVQTIVTLLQHPYGQNVLSGDTLKRLRKAVLFPEELAKVHAEAHKELKCGICGKPFVHGEMTTFIQERADPEFVCSRCSIPTMAACSKPDCESSMEVNARSLSNLLNKNVCGGHDPANKEKTKVEPIPEDVRRGGIFLDEAVPPVVPPNWQDVGQQARPFRIERMNDPGARPRARQRGGIER